MRILFFLIVICSAFIASCQEQKNNGNENVQPAVATDTVQIQPPQIQPDSFGFTYDSSFVNDYKVKPNESLYEILAKFEVTPQEIYAITNKAKKVVDVYSLRPGQQYRTYASTDSSGGISRMVWQPNLVDYVVFDLEDSLQVYERKKEITTKTATAVAEINSSLYVAMMDKDLSPLLANKLAEIYGWEIDFFGLRKGDGFKVYYEKKYVDGEFYGVGDILAAEFTHLNENHFAYKFENNEVDGYFDEEGNSVQKALLKAPFTYSQRISSRFNYNRFHPILKRRVPHYGIDYAAPYGTSVLSVGDGTVIEADYRGANGNIVKIRHNGTYTTDYLHLSKFANGIKKGVEVKQGQVIGYVGNTGRVTGTHLHYQIDKNGKPVNPLTVDLPASESIPDSFMDRFIQIRNYFQEELNKMPDPKSLITQAGSN